MEDLHPCRQKVERLRTASRVIAPFFALLVFTSRSVLETGLFDPYNNLSYYRVIHHVAWFFALLVLLLWATSWVTRVPVKKLLWFCFTLPVVLAPVLYAWIAGEPLVLNYHQGAVGKVLTDVGSFLWTAPHNRPVILDAAPSVAGLMGVGYFYTRNIPRAIATGLLFFVSFNIMGTLWLGPEDGGPSFFHVRSVLDSHNFMAAFYVSILAAVLYGLLWWAGLLNLRSRAVSWGLLAGTAVFLLYYAAAGLLGWFEFPFDRIVTGIPLATSVFLAILVLSRAAGAAASGPAMALIAGLVIIQAAAFGPVYAGVQARLTSYPPPKWAPQKAPFSHLGLLPEGTFDWSLPWERNTRDDSPRDEETALSPGVARGAP